MTCHPGMDSGGRTAGGAWRALEALACEPAPAACENWLGAALKHLPAGARPWRAQVAGERGDAPVAIMGLRKTRRFGPFGRLASSRWGQFHFSGIPLVRRGHERQGLHGLLWAAAGMGAKAAEFAALPVEGPCMAALEELAREEGLMLRKMVQWERAALDAGRDPQTWWREDIPRKRRKEWSRLMRRLGEAGNVVFEAKDAQADLTPWLEDFLALEARGWKGREGTAIACNAALRRFVESALWAHDAAGQLRFWRLKLDGRVIATLFGFVHGRGLWLGKMAYAEDLGQYSPGVLLIIEATRAILADPEIGFADSCAEPDHPMINHLWKQRLRMADVLVATPEVTKTRARLVFALEALCLRLRGLLKRLWLAWRGYWRGKGKGAAPGSGSSARH